MRIYDKTGEVLLDIPVDDDSYRYRAIAQAKKVELRYSLVDHVELPTGAYIEYQGERYTLWYPSDFKKEGTRVFDYTVTFGGNEEILKKYKYKLLSDKPYKLKFVMTATPGMFMELLVDNLNLYDSGWTVGTVIEAPEKLLSFNHEKCWAVLGRLAEEFDTEFEIVGKTINLRKVEYYKDAPLKLSYGKGNGFLPGVGRANQGDNLPVEILYVQGGERNIDYSVYGSQTLLLPKSQELSYQGRRYKTDKDGMYVTRADRPLSSYNEDSYDASDIYPSRVGTVSETDTEPGKDTDGNDVTFYNFYDSSVPANLNFEDCLIAGQTMTVIFQTGRLAGREFDVKYVHDGRKFEIVSSEQDGMTLPNASLYPEVGDKYAVFNISLPAAYVCDNATKTGASWDMLSKAFRIGDDNAFLSYDQRDGLVLKGSIYQSPSGEIDYPEVDRGAYSDKSVYYPGDKVSYDGNVYKCISQTTPGTDPTNTRFWKPLVSKGSNSFKSTVFIRTNATPDTPVGGSYASPLPTTEGWSDGIPSGEAILWASTRIFSSDGKEPQQTAWMSPRQMTDTADFDVEFSSVASPSAPNGHPNTNKQWSDTQSTDTVWMATSTKRNGVWSAWSVSKIKGEEGKPGKDGIDGTDGEDGKDGDPGPRGDRGPRCTYRGDYDSSATYNASSKITDIVSIKNSDGTRTYYVAKVDDNEPTFKGKHPTNTAYWDTFGANFSSVATDLLMARKIAASEIDVESITSNIVKIGNFVWGGNALVGINDAILVVSGAASIGYTDGWAARFSDKVYIEGMLSCDSVNASSLDVPKILYKEGNGVVFNAPGGRYPFLGVRIDNGNGIYGWNSPGNIANLYINKDAASTAHVYITNYQGLTSSDIRLKSVFFDIPDVLDKLEGISAFYYTMKEDEDKIPRIGVSAQAVREVLPEAVQLITPDNGDSYYGVDYIQMLTAFGINGIKELHAKVKALEKRVEVLENR